MSSPAAEDQTDVPSARRPHFLTNVLWSWGGVALNIFIGIFISRFLIRKLEDERYGIWVLVTSLIDYLWFFDLGFNTAVTNFLARFRARNEPEKINVVMNTALLYFSGVSAVLITIAVFASQHVDLMFPKTSAQDRHDLAALLLITGVSYGLFQMVHIFTSALDGFQRFDLTTRSYATMLFVRSAGIITVLSMGYGLRALGGVYMAGQAIGYAMNVMSFRRVFPELRLVPWRFASRPMLKEMVRYGIPSFGVNVSNLVLGQSATILIGRYRGMSDAGYYALPSRILQYLVDAVSRVALVTRSNAAEREASGQKESVWKLGVFSNRYCFMLFAPLALYLLVYGHNLVLIWLKQSYADNSAPILYILVPAIWIVMAGQYNSSAILFGLGTHDRYAKALMVEAAANVAGMIFVIPRYGIVGAACVASGLMLLVRGIYTPYVLCKSLDGSLWRFLYEIYVMPIVISVPTIGVAILLKRTWLPGNNFGQLVLAGGLVAATYIALAMFTCVDREHRVMLIEKRSVGAQQRGGRAKSVRSPREISFRLRQELANLRMFIMPPALTVDQKPPLPGLPDPALIADRLRGSEFAATIETLAEQILAHRFPLLAYEIDTGPDIDWQRDYVHGIRPDVKYFRLVPYLDFHKAGDHKVIWELSRHQHLVVLAQAFLLTGRAEFVAEIQKQLESWFAGNPYLRGMNFTSALEVAFRALSWIWVYHLVGSAMPAAFRHRLLGSIYRHGAYLEYNLSLYFSPNTHLLGEGVALHAIGRLFPKFPHTRRWKRLGAEIVDEALDKQVRGDGTHFEQSTYYHVYSLDLFLVHYILAGKVPRKLEKMAEYLHAVMGPQRTLPFFGDDDGGRLFHPYGTRSEFGRATMATCAVLFERPDWDVEIRDLEEQAIWWLGDRAMPKPADSVVRELQLFEDAGIAVITEGELHVVADSGTFEKGSGGHSHSDTLSFVMRLGEEEILIDPGTYTYVAEPEIREWFRSSAAHNTIRIDGLNQATAVGPFRWMEHPETDVWKQKDGALEGVCQYHGFTHRRRILVQRQRLLVHDEVFGPKGVHVVEQFWHAGEPAEQLAPNLFQIGTRTMLTVSTPATLEKGWRSRVLGHKELAPVIRCGKEGPLPVTFTTEFVWK